LVSKIVSFEEMLDLQFKRLETFISKPIQTSMAGNVTSVSQSETVLLSQTVKNGALEVIQPLDVI